MMALASWRRPRHTNLGNGSLFLLKARSLRSRRLLPRHRCRPRRRRLLLRLPCEAASVSVSSPPPPCAPVRSRIVPLQRHGLREAASVFVSSPPKLRAAAPSRILRLQPTWGSGPETISGGTEFSVHHRAESLHPRRHLFLLKLRSLRPLRDSIPAHERCTLRRSAPPSLAQLASCMLLTCAHGVALSRVQVHRWRGAAMLFMHCARARRVGRDSAGRGIVGARSVVRDLQ